MRLGWRILVAGALAAAAAGAAFAVHRSSAGSSPAPVAVERARAAGDALPAAVAAVASQLGFRTSESRRVAPMTFLVPREPDRLCILSIFRNELPYGCGEASDFFGGRDVVTSVVEDGKPGAPTRLRVFGVARTEVRSVRIVFRGTARTLPVSKDGGFAFDADSVALASGEPLRIETLDEGGSALTTQPLAENP